MNNVQNNRLHHRKWLKSNLEQQRAFESRDENFTDATNSTTDVNNRPEHPLRQSLYAGFEYAVQRDGSSLAESQWKERRRNNANSLMNSDTDSSSLITTAGQHTVNNSKTRLSLTQIESRCRDALNRYQEKEKLPDKPACKPTQSSFPVTNNVNICNSMPPPQPCATTTTESSISAQSYGISTATPHTNPYNRNKVATDQRPPLTPVPPSLEPSNNVTTGRKRNRHNAVFGQFLPNALNSPGCAAKVFGPKAALNEEREICKNILFQNSHPNNNGTLQSSSTAVNNAQPQNQSSFVDEDDDYDDILAGLDVDTLVAQHKRKSTDSNNNPDFGAISPIQSRVDNSFPYPDKNDHEHSSMQYSPVSTNVSNVNRNSIISISSSDYSGTRKATDDTSNLSISTSSFATTSSSFAYPPDSTAPLCPGHNMPCTLLTSSTAANLNRQFYKCAMAKDEDRCDFFQWKDLQDTSYTIEYNNDASSAGVKDIYVENRKKFGHHSFRPGQVSSILMIRNNCSSPNTFY